ncbi:MAG: acyl-CoA thioester hydrolase [Flavobacteriales bacterium]|jgi:acyl-CoA thioester hydrolase
MKSVCEIEVRFRDIDALGHVNNAVYFSYFEQARIKFFADHLGQWNWKEYGLLLAHSEIDYLAPLYLNDKVTVETWCAHLGKKSLNFVYEVFTHNEGALVKVAKGMSVLVSFDYLEKRTIEIPVAWRAKLMSNIH